DVHPQDCTASPADPEELPCEVEPQLARTAQPTGSETPTLTTSPGQRVKLTNLGKVYWPEEDYTKGDLLDYYAAVADVMLPLLADRPVVLVRYPNGILGKSFYQWRAPEGTPEWIRTLELYDEEKQQERGSGKA